MYNIKNKTSRQHQLVSSCLSSEGIGANHLGNDGIRTDLFVTNYSKFPEDIAARIKSDRCSSFNRDFLPYFSELLSELNLDQSYLENLYCDDVNIVVKFMSMIKYKQEFIEFIRYSNATMWVSFSSCVEQIIHLLKQKSDINSIASMLNDKFHRIYEEFVGYKNLKTLNDALTMIEELQKVKLPNSSNFSKPNNYFLQLRGGTDVFSYDAENTNQDTNENFDELYNAEEPPYLKEEQMLKFLHPMWEVKAIIDFENDKDCLSQLVEIKKVSAFYNVIKKIKLINSFEDNEMLQLFLQFMKLAEDILKDKQVLEKIKVIKLQGQSQCLIM
jgi:hypothetical protein